MIKQIEKAANILKNNSLFLQPFLLYLLTVLTILIYLNGRILTFYSRIILLIALLLLFAVFCSGWFYIIKLGITSYKKDDTKEEITAKSIQNFKQFFDGVGAYVCRFTGTFIIVMLIYILTIFALSELCLNLFGMPEIYNDILKLENASSQAEKLNIINNIPLTSQIVFVKWALVLYPASMLLNFFAVLCFGVIFFEDKNIFTCLLKSIKFFFKNIGYNIIAIIVLQIIYFVINIISALLGINVIALFIITMLLTIYFNYYIILVFCLYYDKSQNNSDNGSELIGENEISG